MNINDAPKPKSKFELFKWLYTGKLPLNPLWQNKNYRNKFLLRTIFVSPRTISWLDSLSNFTYLNHYLARQTNLPCKLQRPYLSTTMTNKACLNALNYHYHFFDNCSEDIINVFYGSKPYLIAEAFAKNNDKISLYVQAEDKFAREGEITIYFHHNDHKEYLAALTFSIIEYNNKPTLFIAGLQGANSSQARELIQQATKASYGTFPKRMVVKVALCIAHHFNLQQVVAVSNKTHIYNNWRYKSRFAKLHSDYDSFWQTLGAEIDSNNIFILPKTLHRKAIEDVASKKRSEYRNRYQLLDNVSNAIFEQLLQLKN